ncbi:hypothetical protein [Paenibacillus sp. RC67]|uniref:hypothetical protein n=1 Tax=Paenibacillus sp. RC67 TaxID=3039392 RepID=UPI0032C246D3
MAAFEKIRRRIHTPIAAEIERQLLMNHYAEAAALLLEHYYDPRYEHSGERHGHEYIHLQIDDPNDGVNKVTSFLQQLKLQQT